MLKDVICTNCRKLLLRVKYGEGEIKCKCGQICTYKIVSQKAINEEMYSA